MLGAAIPFLLAGTAIAAPVPPGDYAIPVDIRAGSLGPALQDLARQTGIELLFDRALVRGLSARRVKGKLQTQVALRTLLDGTNLIARRAASGAWIVERQSATKSAVPEELAQPEIVVVGRRTQNVDIRRRETDVQPYQVATGEQIRRAHRDDLDQYFRSRVTANTQVVSTRYRQVGETYSQIDMRGLGTDQTLILVDGRRLPGAPESAFTLLQSDLNAIPLPAIERVETLTGTAGGIHGFGALGGVVNVVLRRDYRSLELHGTAGTNMRGARRLSLGAGLGFTPDGGDTDVSLYLSRTWERGLLEAEGGYILRGREIAQRLVPDIYSGSRTWIDGNGVNVFGFSFDNGNLVFKPEFGGSTLAGSRTFLPRGFTGTPADLVAALAAHAGEIDFAPSDERKASDLGSTPATTSAILNVRHRFGSGAEAYFDALFLRNQGRFNARAEAGQMVLDGSSPLNPFKSPVVVTFPTRPAPEWAAIGYASQRYTAGVIVPLGHQWKATAEASFGAADYAIEAGHTGYFSYLPFEEPIPNPFGDWETFQDDLDFYTRNKAGSRKAHNRYREQSLRLAGPLFRTGAGPAALTLLLQNRTEKVPRYTQETFSDTFGAQTYITDYEERSSATNSLYAEINAPLIAENASFPIMRSLELQLAVRHDRQSHRFSLEPAAPESVRAHVGFSGTAFTVGAKVLPVRWLMLRGSFATGQQPPPIQNLAESSMVSDLAYRVDPRRSNTYYGDEGSYLVRMAGSAELKAVQASTLTFGVVLNPRGERGPRFSIDYSHIHRTGDPVWVGESAVLENEDLWPDRVTRLPLTDADRALGYTGGKISVVDARMMNAGTLDIASVDAKLDWTLPLMGGMLRSYGAATWHIRSRSTGLFDARDERAGYWSGPLHWRGNGGLDWSSGNSLVGANFQYFSRYRIAPNEAVTCCTGGTERLQGSRYVAAQAYLDLYASQRFQVQWAGKERAFSIDLGLVNLLDTAPPYDAFNAFVGAIPMYSPYGDPRRRRFELTLNANF